MSLRERIAALLVRHDPQAPDASSTVRHALTSNDKEARLAALRILGASAEVPTAGSLSAVEREEEDVDREERASLAAFTEAAAEAEAEGEEHGSFRFQLTMPRSAGVRAFLAQCALDANVDYRVLDESKGVFRTTISVAVDGAGSDLAVFARNVRKGLAAWMDDKEERRTRRRSRR